MTHHLTAPAQAFKDRLKEFDLEIPEVHFVLGSGYSNAVPAIHQHPSFEWVTDLKLSELPGGIAASAPGHPGKYSFFRNKKTKKVITLQQGRLHGYEGLAPKEVVKTVLIPFFAGTKNFVLTNAAGSLKREHPVGSVLLLNDHVNMTGQNPLIGENPDWGFKNMMGPRFPDLSFAYSKEMRSQLKKHLLANQLIVHEGVYLGLMGPSFETPAEVKLFAQWGLDVVGMSTVWESIALNHVGAKVAGLSLVSNLGCGLDPEPIDHLDVLRIGKSKAEQILKAFFDWQA